MAIRGELKASLHSLQIKSSREEEDLQALPAWEKSLRCDRTIHALVRDTLAQVCSTPADLTHTPASISKISAYLYTISPESLEELTKAYADTLPAGFFEGYLKRFQDLCAASPVWAIPKKITIKHKHIAVLSPYNVGLGHSRTGKAIAELFLHHHYNVLHISYPHQVDREDQVIHILRTVAAFHPMLVISTGCFDGGQALLRTVHRSLRTRGLLVNTDYSKRTQYREEFDGLTLDISNPHPEFNRAGEVALGFPVCKEISRPRTAKELTKIRESLGILEGYDVALFSLSDYDELPILTVMDLLKSMVDAPEIYFHETHLILNLRSIHGDAESAFLKPIAAMLESRPRDGEVYQIGNVRITLLPETKTMGDLYHVSDTICAKQGGAATAEMIHMHNYFGKRLLVTPSYMCDKSTCEFRNALFLEKSGSVTNYTSALDLEAQLFPPPTLALPPIEVPDPEKAYLAYAASVLS